jgi:hypothetical protein
LQLTSDSSGTGASTSSPKRVPNARTAWLDGSAIYGSEDDVAQTLWDPETGLLRIAQLDTATDFGGYVLGVTRGGVVGGVRGGREFGEGRERGGICSP